MKLWWNEKDFIRLVDSDINFEFLHCNILHNMI